MQRRLAQFKANKRGYYSFWIFAVLFALCVFAEGIANDKPLFMWLNGKAYFPAAITYPETSFGGDFETEADYHDPYVTELLKKNNALVVWPPIQYGFDTINYAIPKPAPAGPDAENWLGTDDQGRDVLARLIYGMRLSLLFGLCLTVFSSIVGVAAGAVQGYFGGKTDIILQRFIEVWGGLPVLFILIIASSIITPGFFTLLLIMLAFSWTTLVDVVRAEFLRARNFDYVRAAKAMGVNNITIMIRHVLPNAMTATLSMLPFILAGSVTVLTSLDFLGFGMPPGSPSLGELLAQGKNNLQAPWLGLTAFVALAIVLTLLAFIGEAVRDAFDPRKVFK